MVREFTPLGYIRKLFLTLTCFLLHPHLYQNRKGHAALGTEIYRAVLRQKSLNAIRKLVEICLHYYHQHKKRIPPSSKQGSECRDLRTTVSCQQKGCGRVTLFAAVLQFDDLNGFRRLMYEVPLYFYALSCLTSRNWQRFSLSVVSRDILWNVGCKVSHRPHQSWWQSITEVAIEIFQKVHVRRKG